MFDTHYIDNVNNYVIVQLYSHYIIMTIMTVYFKDFGLKQDFEYLFHCNQTMATYCCTFFFGFSLNTFMVMELYLSVQLYCCTH